MYGNLWIFRGFFFFYKKSKKGIDKINLYVYKETEVKESTLRKGYKK